MIAILIKLFSYCYYSASYTLYRFLKVNPRIFKLYHAYSISFSSRNVGEFAWS